MDHGEINMTDKDIDEINFLVDSVESYARQEETIRSALSTYATIYAQQEEIARSVCSTYATIYAQQEEIARSVCSTYATIYARQEEAVWLAYSVYTTVYIHHEKVVRLIFSICDLVERCSPSLLKVAEVLSISQTLNSERGGLLFYVDEKSRHFNSVSSVPQIPQTRQNIFQPESLIRKNGTEYSLTLRVDEVEEELTECVTEVKKLKDSFRKEGKRTLISSGIGLFSSRGGNSYYILSRLKEKISPTRHLIEENLTSNVDYSWIRIKWG